VTLIAPTAYLATSSVVVTCIFQADGTAPNNAAAVTKTATISATQTCAPIAWTFDQVVASTGFKLTGPYTASAAAATIAPTFKNFFNMGTASATCNGGGALTAPTCELLTPRGYTSTAIIGFASTSTTATPDDSAVPVTAQQNALGYNTTYAL